MCVDLSDFVFQSAKAGGSQEAVLLVNDDSAAGRFNRAQRGVANTQETQVLFLFSFPYKNVEILFLLGFQNNIYCPLFSSRTQHFALICYICALLVRAEVNRTFSRLYFLMCCHRASQVAPKTATIAICIYAFGRFVFVTGYEVSPQARIVGMMVYKCCISYITVPTLNYCIFISRAKNAADLKHAWHVDHRRYRERARVASPGLARPLARCVRSV